MGTLRLCQQESPDPAPHLRTGLWSHHRHLAASARSPRLTEARALEGKVSIYHQLGVLRNTLPRKGRTRKYGQGRGVGEAGQNGGKGHDLSPRPGKPQRNPKYVVRYREGRQVGPVKQGAGERPAMRSDGGTAGRRPEGTFPIGWAQSSNLLLRKKVLGSGQDSNDTLRSTLRKRMARNPSHASP